MLYLSYLPLLLAIPYLSHGSPLSLDRRGKLTPTLVGSPSNMTSGQAGTYPRANLLFDGSVIGTFTGFSDALNHLQVVHSTDAGASWTTIGTAAEGPSASNDLDNPYILQLPSGRLLLACRNHDFVAASTPRQYTYFRVTIFSSDDQGYTWSYISTPAQHAATTVNNGLWEPFMRVGADGNVQLYYSEEDAADDQNTMRQVSTDEGATWGEPTMVTGDGVTARDGMCGIAPFEDKLVMVFESVPPNGTFTVNAVTSYDDGWTWSDRRTVYSPYGENNNAGAPQIVNVGGTLVVSFMTDEDTQLHKWVTGAGSKLVTSCDGWTWGNELEVFAPQANWPGMVALDDTTLLFMADKDNAKAQQVTLS